ncbi:hypothetical protein PINS_up001835 [Pythium insidiosum]|nr:hypothetical protein PINS_up001835 [Pythium insidiosum]
MFANALSLSSPSPPPSTPAPSSSPSSSMGRSVVERDREDVASFSMTLRQRAVLNNEAEMTSLLLFHPYETMLIVADEKDQISMYNVEQSEKKVLTFGNKNPTGYVFPPPSLSRSLSGSLSHSRAVCVCVKAPA